MPSIRDFDYLAAKIAVWDNEMLNLVSQVHEFNGRFMQMPPLKASVHEKLLAATALDSIESSNRIEGITTTPQKLRQLVSGAANPRSLNEKQILGYKEAVDIVNRSYQTISTVRISNILQLHMTIYGHTKETHGGQFKEEDNAIVQELRDGSRVVLFQPPPSYQTPLLMERLCYAADEAFAGEGIDPLILIPMFVLDFLCIHPFTDGNGRVSRLLTSLLLHMYGYDIDWYFSLDGIIERTKSNYYRSLAASSTGWHEAANDYVPFIKYLLGVILKGYKLFFEMFAPFKTAPTSPFKPLAIDLVRAAVDKKTDRFTKAELMRELPTIGKSSIENALNTLVQEGIIFRHGAARGTYYSKEAFLQSTTPRLKPGACGGKPKQA